MLPRPEVCQVLSHATVFVCPSVYEPLGIVNLEAMACGAAVVGTATGGIPEVVVHGETGWLVPIEQLTDGTGTPVDPDRYVADLAAALTEAVSDPERARRFGEAGRVRANQEFSWATVAGRTVEVYERALASAALSPARPPPQCRTGRCRGSRGGEAGTAPSVRRSRACGGVVARPDRTRDRPRGRARRRAAGARRVRPPRRRGVLRGRAPSRTSRRAGRRCTCSWPRGARPARSGTPPWPPGRPCPGCARPSCGGRPPSWASSRSGCSTTATARWRTWTPDVLAGEVEAEVRRVRPHVVVTFGPEGGYGHPDHRTIGDVTTVGRAPARATRATRTRPQRLYHACFPPQPLVLAERLARWLDQPGGAVRGRRVVRLRPAAARRGLVDPAPGARRAAHRLVPGRGLPGRAGGGRGVAVPHPVRAGRASSRRSTGGGRTLRTMGPGEFFGELGLAGGGVRTADVVAEESVTCARARHGPLSGRRLRPSRRGGRG